MSLREPQNEPQSAQTPEEPLQKSVNANKSGEEGVIMENGKTQQPSPVKESIFNSVNFWRPTNTKGAYDSITTEEMGREGYQRISMKSYMEDIEGNAAEEALNLDSKPQQKQEISQEKLEFISKEDLGIGSSSGPFKKQKDSQKQEVAPISVKSVSNIKEKGLKKISYSGEKKIKQDFQDTIKCKRRLLGKLNYHKELTTEVIEVPGKKGKVYFAQFRQNKEMFNFSAAELFEMREQLCLSYPFTYVPNFKNKWLKEEESKHKALVELFLNEILAHPDFRSSRICEQFFSAERIQKQNLVETSCI